MCRCAKVSKVQCSRSTSAPIRCAAFNMEIQRNASDSSSASNRSLQKQGIGNDWKDMIHHMFWVAVGN